MAVVIPPFFCAQGERRRQSSIDSNEAHANRCGACLMLTRLDDYRRENGCQASLRSSQIERAQVCPGMSINVEHVHAGWQQRYRAIAEVPPIDRRTLGICDTDIEIDRKRRRSVYGHSQQSRADPPPGRVAGLRRRARLKRRSEITGNNRAPGRNGRRLHASPIVLCECSRTGSCQFGRQHDQKKYADRSLSDDVQVRAHSALTCAAFESFFLSSSASGTMTRQMTASSHATSMYDCTVAWVITEL